MTKTIVVYRSERGSGDACMLLPTVEKLEELNPEAEIVVVMDRPQSAVFEHKKYTIIPVERFDITDYDEARFYNVSRCCLQYEQLKRQNIAKSRFDLFAEHCGVRIEEKGTIPITEEEIIHIHNRVPVLRRGNSDDKVVGIVLKSAQSYRNYPHTDILLDYFKRCPIFRRDSQVIPILIDHEEEIEGIISTKDLDIREMLVLISQLDLMMGPDTGPMHVAGTLGIPTLWLFGPTDPRLRVSYYPNAEYIWNPCKEGKACWYDYCGFLHCLWMISPWEVAKRARKILEKGGGDALSDPLWKAGAKAPNLGLLLQNE